MPNSTDGFEIEFIWRCVMNKFLDRGSLTIHQPIVDTTSEL